MNILYVVLVVLLILLLVGGIGPWGGGPYFGYGWRGGAPIGLIIVVLLVLILFWR
jgi:hypothetical protein